jgi:hypothetical protein
MVRSVGKIARDASEVVQGRTNRACEQSKTCKCASKVKCVAVGTW